MTTTPRTTKRPPRKRLTPLRVFWRLLLGLLLTLVLLGALALAGVLGVFYYYSRGLPDPAQIGQRRPAETTRIYARDGKTLLYELVDPEGGRRTIIEFARIPQMLKDATIAVEDADFYRNPGVDLRAIVRALWLNYQSGEIVSGASTITQQLVRRVLLPVEERSELSFERKLREAILAYQVSQRYSKDQILSLYLNEVYYGGQAYGIQAAAQAYFGKNVWNLNAAELTLIAGLPQSPTTLDPFINFEGARARQKIVLDLMVKQGYLTAPQADQIYATPVRLVPQTPSLVAPHFVFYVRQQLEQHYGPDLLYKGGLRVVTSIDLSWQAEAQRIVRERVAELRARNGSNAGVIMLSPDNQILAMVGSVDYRDTSIDGQVNVTLARRQPGSALKPVVYAAAMRQGWTPATVIWDVPSSFNLPDGGSYQPLNYDNAWHGPQRLRMALANSLNIPAVKALEYAGIEAFVEQASRLGITSFDDPARYGLAMALGSNEVRLLDLTNVYSTLQNAGRERSPAAILRVSNARGEVLERWTPDAGRQVLGDRGEQLAFLLTDILSDNLARHYMFGRNNVMELPDGRAAAVKTGTSNEWRDSWAVGYTPDITIGVWVGNSDSSPMQEVAGSNGAGLIWRDLMLLYHEGRPARGFTRPEGVIEVPICADTGGLASDYCRNRTSEWFLAGSEPKIADVSAVKVLVAGDGTCLAASYSPPGEVREASFPLYPPEFRDWARSAGIPQPPSEPCAPPQRELGLLAQISEPTGSTPLTTTQVLIGGSARGSYTLEYGSGSNPSDWQPITTGSSDGAGLLGVWLTGGLPPGEYTLRLRVTTPDRLVLEDRRVVRLVR